LPGGLDRDFIYTRRRHLARALSTIADEASMRNLFALLALIGLAGIALGVLTIVRAAPGMAGPLGFAYENYGGPGSMLAGLMLLATSLYLRAVWQGRD
jgi:hypothetical protein